MEKRGKVNVGAADLKDIECFVLDMDGTINLGDRLIEGAREYIECMQQKGNYGFIFSPTTLPRRRLIMLKSLSGLVLRV